MLKSILSAFLMYSRIPVPTVEWKEENRRYSLCFFWLIGVVIGGAFLLWRFFCWRLNFNETLTGAGSAVIPLFVTGGIHMDGFCDVNDAKASYGDKEKRLEIMKDSHVGAFAVINAFIYLIMQTALFSQAKTPKTCGIIAIGFVVSRALSGLTAVTFQSAKKSGTLQNFTEPADKRITLTTLIIITILCFTAMIFIDVFSGIICTLTIICVTIYYKKFSYKTFGGITGDLSGWFLQICEISLLTSAVFSEALKGVVK